MPVPKERQSRSAQSPRYGDQKLSTSAAWEECQLLTGSRLWDAQLEEEAEQLAELAADSVDGEDEQSSPDPLPSVTVFLDRKQKTSPRRAPTPIAFRASTPTSKPDRRSRHRKTYRLPSSSPDLPEPGSREHPITIPSSTPPSTPDSYSWAFSTPKKKPKIKKEERHCDRVQSQHIPRSDKDDNREQDAEHRITRDTGIKPNHKG